MQVYIFVQDLGDGSTGLDFVSEYDLDKFTELYEDSDYYRDGDGFGPKYALTFDSIEDAKHRGVNFWNPDEYEDEEE